MKERLELLGIPMDTAATKVAAATTKGYLEQESSNTVYFVNSETLLLLQQNTDWKEIVEECGLVLPGTVNVNTSIDEVLGYKRDPFFFESYMDAVLDYGIEMGYEFLLVTESEEQFISVQEHFHEKRPLLTLSGFFRTEQDETLEHIVNEINSVAPDILIVCLEEEKQLQLLQSHRNQMNANLVIYTGNILYNRAVSDAQVPENIQKLKIDNLYKWFRMGGKIKTFFNNIRMKIYIKKHHKEKDTD